MLPEFSDVGAAKAAVGALFGLSFGDEMGEVFFDVGFDCGACAFEVAESLEFIGDELVVGRVLQGQKAVEEIHGVGGPEISPITSAGFGLVGCFVFQVVGAKLIEPGTADSKTTCRSGGIKFSEVECLEDLEDECGREAVDQLFVFTMSTVAFSCACGNQVNWVLCPQTPGVFRIRPIGLALLDDAAPGDLT